MKQQRPGQQVASPHGYIDASNYNTSISLRSRHARDGQPPDLTQVLSSAAQSCLERHTACAVQVPAIQPQIKHLQTCRLTGQLAKHCVAATEHMCSNDNLMITSGSALHCSPCNVTSLRDSLVSLAS